MPETGRAKAARAPDDVGGGAAHTAAPPVNGVARTAAGELGGAADLAAAVSSAALTGAPDPPRGTRGEPARPRRAHDPLGVRSRLLTAPWAVLPPRLRLKEPPTASVLAVAQEFPRLEGHHPLPHREIDEQAQLPLPHRMEKVVAL